MNEMMPFHTLFSLPASAPQTPLAQAEPAAGRPEAVAETGFPFLSLLITSLNPAPPGTEAPLDQAPPPDSATEPLDQPLASGFSPEVPVDFLQHLLQPEGADSHTLSGRRFFVALPSPPGPSPLPEQAGAVDQTVLPPAPAPEAEAVKASLPSLPTDTSGSTESVSGQPFAETAPSDAETSTQPTPLPGDPKQNTAPPQTLSPQPLPLPGEAGPIGPTGSDTTPLAPLLLDAEAVPLPSLPDSEQAPLSEQTPSSTVNAEDQTENQDQGQTLTPPMLEVEKVEDAPPDPLRPLQDLPAVVRFHMPSEKPPSAPIPAPETHAEPIPDAAPLPEHAVPKETVQVEQATTPAALSSEPAEEASPAPAATVSDDAAPLEELTPEGAPDTAAGDRSDAQEQPEQHPREEGREPSEIEGLPDKNKPRSTTGAQPPLRTAPTTSAAATPPVEDAKAPAQAVRPPADPSPATPLEVPPVIPFDVKEPLSALPEDQPLQGMADRSVSDLRTEATRQPTPLPPHQAMLNATLLRNILAAGQRSQPDKQGWQMLEMKLDDGDGTLTIKTRQEADQLSIHVSFSDPNLRAVAEAHLNRLRDALRSHYDTDVDLTLSNGDTGSSNHDEQARSAERRNRSSALGQGSAQPETTERPVRLAPRAGSRHVWVG